MRTRLLFAFNLTLALLFSPALPFPKLLRAADSSVVLGKVEWMTNKDFPDELRKYSPTIANAVAGWQRLVADSPQSTMKHYHYRKFSMTVRPHFPVEVTVSHSGRDMWGREIWFIVLSKADTDMEGPNAAKMLEIVGRQWKLISHWAVHAPDRSVEKYVIATGTVPHG